MVEKEESKTVGLSQYTRETIEDLAQMAYLYCESSPDSRNCRNLHEYMERRLEDTLVFAGQLPRGEENIAKAPHSFLRFFGNSISWVADAQYQQYVPKEERDGLPPVMFVPITNPSTFCLALRDRFHIPEEHHYLWVDLIFSTQTGSQQA